ncbi:MAG: hypothetical protein CMP69_00995 [Flavobacteriales bacterium]|nr:hypothetical protein [Flavobacteriales bacterium]|tara:strand:- start:2075 stop:3142 length:1068 start_codon:yes stop_codon:yes gene_type:complete
MKIFLVSNMYPSKQDPLFGVFVKNFCKGLESLGVDISLKSIIKGKSKNILKKTTKYLIYVKSLVANYYLGKYDLIYIHYLSINSIFFRLLLFHKNSKSIIVNVHGSDVVQEGFFMSYFNKYLLKRCHLIIAPSEYFKKKMLNKYSFLISHKIFVSPSAGIDPKVFYNYENFVKKENLTLGYVSRIDKGKGWDIFLDLLVKLDEQGLLVNSIVIGDGLLRKDFLNRVKHLNIKNIKYLGMISQDKLIDWFNYMDLFIFPTTLPESLGLVGLESMACGTPVIGSNIAGPAEYIKDGFNGFKFRVGDVKDLLMKVNDYLLLTKIEKKKMKNNAFKTSLKYQNENVILKLKKKIDNYVT